MKRIAVLAVIGLACSITAYCADAAAVRKNMKIGFVDVKKVFDSCTATQKATLTLKKAIDAKQEALAKEQDEIAMLQKELKDKEVVLSQPEKKKRQAEIEARIAALQKEAEQARLEMTKKEQEMTEEIIVSIKGVITSIAKSGGFDLVLEKDSILYGEEVTDLTGRVVEELNKK